MRTDSTESESISLLRSEAEQRARTLDVTAMLVELDLTGAGETFTSTATIRFRAEPDAATFLDFKGRRLVSATLNGEPVPTERWRSGRIELTGLRAENTVVVTGEMAYSSDGEGLHRHVDPADGRTYLYAMSFLDAAPRWFACFDQPDLKSPYEFRVAAPEDWTVIGNGPAEALEPGRWRIVQPRPLSTYFVTLVAGPYASVLHEHDGIRLGFHVRASLGEQLRAEADDLIEVTAQSFDHYHRLFGVRYPFGEYHQAFVPDFNAGAMENPGCITIRDQLIYRSRVTTSERAGRAGLIAHEMAHQWFGDLVTMRWWDDLWLNESFAEWASHWCNSEATRFTDAWTTFLALRKRWGYGQDQLPTTHPVYTDVPDVETVEVNFDGITYAKGASILKQIVAYVGRDAFVRGLRAYFPKHAWGNATFDDLLGALEEASGRELREYASQWLTTAQVNTLRPEITRDGDRYGTVAVLQEAPKDYPTLRTHRLAIGLYDLREGKLVRRRRVELDVTGERTEVTELAGEPVADVLLINDDDLTYAKIRLDERSMATIVEHVSDFDSSLPRGLVWAAAQDMLRDAELPARQFVRMVASGIGTETDVNLVTILARTARQAVNLYADPAWQDAGRALLTRTFAEALAASEPGSGRQLTFAQEYAALARSADDLAVLRGWLAGENVPEGLTVDTDLRWHLLHSLVALGAAGTAEIDAELARDNTASGQRQASVVRAALPDADSKAAIWTTITTDTSLPNWLQRAMLQGFWHSAQLELLAPYRERYFADVAGVWDTFDGEVAQVFVMLGYPSLLVDDATVAATDAWLTGDHPAPLRRLVAEGKDGVQRALRARACDTAAG